MVSNYHSEFTLEESRWIFRLEDMTLSEQELWMSHLKQQGFTIDDPREIFEPFAGEQSPCSNSDIETQELLIRTWTWTNPEVSSPNSCHQHRLLDICVSPGDIEFGVIVMDGVAIINNKDQDIYWLNVSDIYESDDLFEFDNRLEFFEEIRKDLINWDREVEWELEEDYNQFFASEAGKHAIECETAAWNNYQDRMRKIREEHEALGRKYLFEFTFLGGTIVSKCSRDDVVERIGYKAELGHGKIYKIVGFTLVQWESIEYGSRRLITIFDCRKNHTYLLDDKDKIDRYLYRDEYLVDNYDFLDPIMRALQVRIHSYLKVMRNRVSF